MKWFLIHYKSGIVNTVADALSRYPIDDHQDLNKFKETCCEEENKAILDGPFNQQKNGETWVTTN